MFTVNNLYERLVKFILKNVVINMFYMFVFVKFHTRDCCVISVVRKLKMECQFSHDALVSCVLVLFLSNAKNIFSMIHFETFESIYEKVGLQEVPSPACNASQRLTLALNLQV